MTLPTKAETYTQLTEHLRKAQEASATLAHLANAEGDDKGRLLASGWLTVSEALKLMIHQIILLATKGRLH